MAYESMKTEDLKKELIRRTEDIDSWANEANIEKQKTIYLMNLIKVINLTNSLMKKLINV